jgi:hypothetical protein
MIVFYVNWGKCKKKMSLATEPQRTQRILEGCSGCSKEIILSQRRRDAED